MAYYNVCTECGCTLDPGEKCSCREEEEREQEQKRDFFRAHLKMEPKGRQMALVLDGGGLDVKEDI